MKLLFDCDVLGKGGMRVAKRAEVLENCNHPLTKKFIVGCNFVAKEYTTTVENAANAADRSILSIAKKVL
jgi:hypothetical protein